jgi:DNA recombination protein RmuC
VEVIDEAQKRIKDLSEEMVSLQNILSNNQARGSFGEYQLNQLLVSLFGENKKLYETQYTLKKNKNEVVRADAVIFMPEPKGMIAIDSKFPYSSYSKLFDNKELSKVEEAKIIMDFGREVKKHITDIAGKYIIPGTTTDYAIMFVPSDGILALIHSKLQTIVEYARNKNITIVSPTTLIPLLSSFQSMVIDYERSKHINEIIIQLKKLKTNFNSFESEWAKLNRTIDTLRNDGDKVNVRVERITTRFKDIDKVNFIEDKKNSIDTEEE